MLKATATVLAALLATVPIAAVAENPIIQTDFTADPAPLVHDGTVWLYTSHDEDDSEGFHMLDWKLHSSTDMVNWTDHGPVASLKTFPWAVQTNDAWAPQAMERDGKFFLYVPVSVDGSPKNVIGVAVADNPNGPFVDAIGGPLVGPQDGFIDPTILIDDDGQAYLYWGNPHLWFVKLGRDMISTSGEIEQIEAIPENYQEGPWVYKRAGRYYMAYASTCCPEGIGYAMSDSPAGPWEYKGQLMDPVPQSTGNHPGIVDYKGRSYLFGMSYRLNWAMSPVHHERRSVNLAEFHYNDDGTISTLGWWRDGGPQQIGSLDPYRRVQAETLAWTSRIGRDRDMPYDWAPGVKVARVDETAAYVKGAKDRMYIMVRGVDFGREGASTISARMASPGGIGARVEVRLDAVNGPQIAELTVTEGGWQDVTAHLTVPATGKRNLYFVVRGQGDRPALDFDYWQFTRKD